MATDGWVLDDEGPDLAVRPVKEWVYAPCALREAVVLEPRSAGTYCGASLLPAGSMTVAVDCAAVRFASAGRVALSRLRVLGVTSLTAATCRTSVGVLAYASARRLLACRSSNRVTKTVRSTQLQIWAEHSFVKVQASGRSSRRCRLKLVAPALRKCTSRKFKHDGAWILHRKGLRQGLHDIWLHARAPYAAGMEWLQDGPLFVLEDLKG